MRMLDAGRERVENIWVAVTSGCSGVGDGGGDGVEGKGDGADEMEKSEGADEEKRERAIRTCKRGKARSQITA